MAANLSAPLSIRLPEDVLASIEQIARETDRSRNWVILRALRFYLASEGAEILDIVEGRRQIEAGDVHDMNKVLADIARKLKSRSDEAA